MNIKMSLSIFTLLSSVLFTSALLSSTFSHAATNEEMLNEAQTKLKATFTKMQFTSFKKGPVDGIYEINTGGQIIYFVPEKELLLFGEFYDKEGVSLTKKTIKNNNEDMFASLPIDSAITIGNENADKTIIEFTDPNCGYCKSYDSYITNESNAAKVKRVVFFDSRNSPNSKQKIIHILCSENTQKAMKLIYDGIFPDEYLSCEQGIKTQELHASASQIAGNRGTPSFIIDGKLTLGFTPRIKKFISK